MRSLIIIGLVIITSIIACTKVGRNITVKGKVLNPLTGTTYEGIKVQLIRSKNLQLPGGYTEIKHTHTDANGEFELNATRLGDVWVQAQSGSDLYVLGWYQDGEYISSNFRTTAQKRKTMEADFHVVPYGYVKVNIHNINCEGQSDTLILERNYQEKQVGFFQPTTLTGCYSQEGIPAEVPMGNYEIKWTVKRGGGSETYSENLFIPENDVGEITINY